MKITKVVVFVAVDDKLEVRQLLINKDESKRLIMLIEQGMFTEDNVKISADICESIMFTNSAETLTKVKTQNNKKRIEDKGSLF